MDWQPTKPGDANWPRISTPSPKAVAMEAVPRWVHYSGQRVLARYTDDGPWREVPVDQPLGTAPLPCACGRPEGGHEHTTTRCMSDKDTIIATRDVGATAWGSAGVALPGNSINTTARIP